MNSINYPATLRRGSKGAVVKWLQSFLVGKGYTIAIDGDFGTNTNTAVNDLQKKNGEKVDGLVGPKTWSLLLPAVASYKQNDSRWGKTPYTSTNNKSQTIGSSGCGPACTAMIAASWGHPNTTPAETCAEAKAGGYRTANSGTAHGYFAAFAKRYGFRCNETRDVASVKKALEGGKLVIGNMGPGQFTKSGHFILLWAYDRYSDVIYVLDPGSSRAERTRASASQLHREAKRYFIFER